MDNAQWMRFRSDLGRSITFCMCMITELRKDTCTLMPSLCLSPWCWWHRWPEILSCTWCWRVDLDVAHACTLSHILYLHGDTYVARVITINVTTRTERYARFDLPGVLDPRSFVSCRAFSHLISMAGLGTCSVDVGQQRPRSSITFCMCMISELRQDTRTQMCSLCLSPWCWWHRWP